jgi:hypothetical protein
MGDEYIGSSSSFRKSTMFIYGLLFYYSTIRKKENMVEIYPKEKEKKYIIYKKKNE